MEEKIDEEGFLLQVDIGMAEKSRLPWHMLEHNQLSDLLPFQYYYKDDKVCFCYTTKGLQPIEEYFHKKKGSFDTLYFLCKEIILIVERGEEYLLKSEEYILKPGKVYWNRLEEKICVCYLPGNDGNFKKNYTTLVEYLMEHTEHKDEQAVAFIYGLYDILVSDGFSVEGLKQYFSKFIKTSGKDRDEKGKKTVLGRYMLVYCGESWHDMPLWREKMGEFSVPEQRKVVVGRSPGCDIMIPCPEISRRHAVLFQKGQQIFLMDMGSANGTYLNDRQISGKGKNPCQQGDNIRFANYSFQLL